jgi:poly(beta-D-mannuronate) lyase
MIRPRSNRVPGAVALLLFAITGALEARSGEIKADDPSALARAVKAARPGDTIVLADGTWRDAELVFSAKGEPGRPITLRAQTPGKVVLSGTARLRIAGQDLVVEGLLFTGGAVTSGSVVEFRRDSDEPAMRCRLTGCAIVGYSPQDRKVDTKWVSLYGRENRVDHCYFEGKTNAGTTLVVWVGDQPNQHTIDHNHFGPRAPLGFNGGETIRVGTSDVSMQVSRTLVENNYFEKCDGEVEAISNKSCENIYRHNTFDACSATLTLRHGNRCLVEGNFFLGRKARGSGGVRIIGEGHRVVNNYFEDLEGDEARSAISMMNGVPNSPLNGYFQVKDALVAFNTVVDAKSSFALGVGEGKKNTLPPQDCRIANNLVVSRRSPLVHLFSTPTRLAWEGNLMFGADLGIPTPPGITIADPRLSRGEGGLCRPGPSSPARGAAVGDFPSIRDDIDGQPRAGKSDVGCDQQSDRPATHRPLTAADVGPSWRAVATGGPKS